MRAFHKISHSARISRHVSQDSTSGVQAKKVDQTLPEKINPVISRAPTGALKNNNLPVIDSNHPYDPLTANEQKAAIDATIQYISANRVILGYEVVPITGSIDLSNPTNAPGVWDTILRKEPKRAEVVAWQKNTGAPKPSRAAIVRYYEFKTDIYTSFEVSLLNEVASVVSHQRVTDGRPSYSCMDDLKISELIFTSKIPDADVIRVSLSDRIKARFALSGSSGLTEDNYDQALISFDLSMDGRMVNDGCDNCAGPFDDYNGDGSGNRPRLFYCTPFYNDGNSATYAFYSNPISGLYAIVDVRKNSDMILRIMDEVSDRIIPGATIETYADYLEALRIIQEEKNDPSVPLVITGATDWTRPGRFNIGSTNTNGSSSNIKLTDNRNRVTWGPWSFRLGFNHISGPELYDITYSDPTVWVENHNMMPVPRKLFRKMNIPDILTSYNTPELPGPARAYFDFAEYPARDFLPSLIPGVDVPANALFLDYPVTLSDGSQYRVPNCVALAEMSEGKLWRHIDYPCDGAIVNRGANNLSLEIVWAPVIANYDYVNSIIFCVDGSIKYRLAATGIMEHDNVGYSTIVDVKEDGIHNGLLGGTLVRPGTKAVDHAHRFCIRMEPIMDSELPQNDGTVNVVVASHELMPNDFGADQCEKDPCKITFHEHDVPIGVNTDEQWLHHNFNADRKWVFESSTKTNYVGYPRAYELIPQPIAYNLNNQSNTIWKRTTLARDQNIYVTAFKDGRDTLDGVYVAEQTMNVLDSPEGLLKYIQEDKQDTTIDPDQPLNDPIVWYISGFGHRPHAEQYPVMNDETVSVSIRPKNFFNENPALYVK